MLLEQAFETKAVEFYIKFYTLFFYLNFYSLYIPATVPSPFPPPNAPSGHFPPLPHSHPLFRKGKASHRKSIKPGTSS